ncbi:MAG: hypothetical protein WA709_04575, partial [Stellaceae bacterium]
AQPATASPLSENLRRYEKYGLATRISETHLDFRQYPAEFFLPALSQTTSPAFARLLRRHCGDLRQESALGF